MPPTRQCIPNEKIASLDISEISMPPSKNKIIITGVKPLIIKPKKKENILSARLPITTKPATLPLINPSINPMTPIIREAIFLSRLRHPIIAPQAVLDLLKK